MTEQYSPIVSRNLAVDELGSVFKKEYSKPLFPSSKKVASLFSRREEDGVLTYYETICKSYESGREREREREKKRGAKWWRKERERETEVWKVRQLLKTFNSRVECQFHGVISSKCISVVWWMCCFEMKWKWKRTNGKKKKYADSQIFEGNKYWNKRKRVFSRWVISFLHLLKSYYIIYLAPVNNKIFFFFNQD